MCPHTQFLFTDKNKEIIVGCEGQNSAHCILKVTMGRLLFMKIA